MQIIINGEAREVPTHVSLGTLLERLDLESRRVAVEVNLQLVPRTQHNAYVLQPDDRLEIVTLAGGG